MNEENIVQIKSEDGRTFKFYNLGSIEYKGAEYVALTPAEEMEGLEQDELVIYGLEYVGEEEVELVPIEDQDLLDEVYEEFCRVMDECECDCDGECDCEDCDCEDGECDCDHHDGECHCHDKK